MEKSERFHQLVNQEQFRYALYPYWYVAPIYTVENASENSRGVVVAREKESGDIETRESGRGGVGPYAPLQCPELIPSFARLVAHGKPSEASVLRWVRKYGLLYANEEQGNSHSPANSANQAPISVEDFTGEALQVRSILSLYADLHGGGVDELRKSIGELQIRYEKFEPLSKLDEFLLKNWRKEADKIGPKRITSLQVYATTYLQNSVNEGLSGVQPALFDNLYSMGNSSHRYEPLPSWQCRDLISAMYLQIFLWMVTAVPLQRCAVPTCRTPFPLSRSDKRVCSDSCRSNLRHYR